MQMKERIKNWYGMKNGHPVDDKRFFDIVIDSMTGKISIEVFREAIMDVNSEITEDEVITIYNRYELVRTFLNYYLTRQNANNQH